MLYLLIYTKYNTMPLDTRHDIDNRDNRDNTDDTDDSTLNIIYCKMKVLVDNTENIKDIKQVKKLSKNNKKQLQELLVKLKNKLKILSKDIKPSIEQKTIIDCVSLDNSAYVDAVAGSGKTTVCIFIAKRNKNKSILQITYNKHLKNEVRNKVKNSNVSNLEINTYHSLGVKFYDDTARTDDGIIKIIENNIQPKKIINYDIVVIDEAQDMTPIYYEFINKFIKDMKLEKCILLLMGDRYQSVYQFKKADPRFLTLSKNIWRDNIKLLPLQQSYRVTKQIAYFVNNIMLGYNRIYSDKDGVPVVYLRCNRFASHYKVAGIINNLINVKKYKPDDIFIIAPTIKSSDNPIKKLENELVKKNIPVYYSRQEEESLNEEIISGKVIFTTFHQAKGRERKVVIVYGFDASYFTYFGKDKNIEECPEELYVAVTRASERLYVLEDMKSGALPFLKYTHQQMNHDDMILFDGFIDKEQPTYKKIETDNDGFHDVTVTELIKYINEENNVKLIPLIDMLMIKRKDCNNIVDLPLQIKTKAGLTEDVSDLNGIIIPSIFEYKLTNKSTIFDRCKLMYETKFYDKNITIKNLMTKVLEDYEDPNKIIVANMMLGNLYVSMTEKILSKLNQIDEYSWLNKKIVDDCIVNISNCVSKNIKFEEEAGDMEDNKGGFYQYLSNNYGMIKIRGRFDAFDDDNLWEFKCVENLSREHKLQLIIYSWIYEKCMKTTFGNKKYKILNIRTGELHQIKYENYIVEEIMNILFENKFGKVNKDDDTEFINKCVKIKNKYDKNIKNIKIEEIKNISELTSNSKVVKKSVKRLF